MAIVRSLVHGVLEQGTRHTDADCTYSIVVDGGEKYLQVDTYGSAARKIRGKKSQSIRFSPEAIAQLKTLLAEEF